jgi:predicted Rossmann fold flavoprotein
MMRREEFDAVVLGAGAAGMMCAMTAGRRGRRVLLLDHADEPGRKILISGGGRCNFTNLDVRPERFFSGNPHFCRSALARYTQTDFIALVDRHGIAWHEKTLGQLFCDGSARQIVAMLADACADAGVALRLGQRVRSVTRTDRFVVELDAGEVTAPALVLATGGLSIPKMGATGLAYEIARRFGLPVTELRPALVPLVFGAHDLDVMRPLSGISAEVVASCNGTAFRENLLFTHRGLSGPAILQVSSCWREGEAISIDLLPDADAAAALRAGKRTRPRAALKTHLADLLPQRLAQALAPETLRDRPVAEIADRDLDTLGAALDAWRVVPTGSEGYAKAEVTLGGIDTRALSSKTMEARDIPGLYAIGEAVDVTGWLGGYNFQWAWSSGWCAGQAL